MTPKPKPSLEDVLWHYGYPFDEKITSGNYNQQIYGKRKAEAKQQILSDLLALPVLQDEELSGNSGVEHVAIAIRNELRGVFRTAIKKYVEGS